MNAHGWVEAGGGGVKTIRTPFVTNKYNKKHVLKQKEATGPA